MMINIGFNNYVSKDKIICVSQATSSPITRLRRSAEDNNLFIDCTMGRKTRSYIHTLDGFLIGSAIEADTLKTRII